MILSDFKDFPKQGRLLGIDWGARRAGLAVSDASRGFVFPREVISTADDLIGKILACVNSEKVAGIIIGLPCHADGTDSETTVKVREFAVELSAATDIPIAFVDERLTSVEAKELSESDIDSIAAAIILENAIAMIKRTTP